MSVSFQVKQISKLKYLSAPLFAGVLSSLVSANVLAQSMPNDEQDAIDEVVVSANRIENKRIEVGSTVTVISAEDISERQIISVADAIRQISGVSASRNGGLGGATTIRLRGAESGQALVLINGVKLNDLSSPGGGFNFANLLTDDVERIEILQGPQSTLYGSDAVGGVINIITKKTEKEYAMSGYVEYGSFDSKRAGMTLGFNRGVASGGVTLAVNNSDGISAADENAGNTEADAYKNLSVNGYTSIEIADNLTANFFVRYLDADLNFDAFDFVLGLVDGDDQEFTTDVQAGGSLSLKLFDGRLKNDFRASISNIDREDYALGARTFMAESKRKTFEYFGSFKISDAVNTVFGAEFDRNDIRAEAFGAFASLDTGNADIDSYFAEAQLQPIEGLTLTFGGRNDDHEAFGGATTLRATAAYYLETTGTLMRANWGQGFKAPTLYQLYSAFGNPNLRPEESDGWEVGFEQEIGDKGARLSAVWFNRDVTNQIDFSFATFAYDNLVSTNAKGLEARVHLPLGDTIKVDANYTYLKAIDATLGTQLIRRPKNSAFIAVRYQPLSDVSVSSSLRYVGSQLETGATLPAFTVVDLRASWQLRQDIELYGRIENLFNKEYQEVLLYGTPDAAVYVGLKVRL